MAEWCTKQSFCPSAGVTKPKPFASLNHLTTPVVRMMCSSKLICAVVGARVLRPTAVRTDDNVLVTTLTKGRRQLTATTGTKRARNAGGPQNQMPVDTARQARVLRKQCNTVEAVLQ